MTQQMTESVLVDKKTGQRFTAFKFQWDISQPVMDDDVFFGLPVLFDSRGVHLRVKVTTGGVEHHIRVLVDDWVVFDDSMHAVDVIAPGRGQTAYAVVVESPSESVEPREAVNHPDHYTGHPSEVECIELADCMGFSLGNAFKYLYRTGNKDPEKEAEDIKKAEWYIKYELEKRERIPFRRLRNWLAVTKLSELHPRWDAADRVVKYEKRYDGRMAILLELLLVSSQTPYSIKGLESALHWTHWLGHSKAWKPH